MSRPCSGAGSAPFEFSAGAARRSDGRARRRLACRRRLLRSLRSSRRVTLRWSRSRTASFVRAASAPIASRRFRSPSIARAPISTRRSQSDLERLLEQGEFDRDLLIERAGELRRLIVDAGIGKYERGVTAARPAGRGASPHPRSRPGRGRPGGHCRRMRARSATSTCSQGCASRRPTHTSSTSRIRTCSPATVAARFPTRSASVSPTRSSRTCRSPR